MPAGRQTALDTGFLDGLREALPDALDQLSPLPLRHVYLACTSAGFTAQQPRPVPTASTITAFDAVLDALKQQRASRIVLATPYPHEIADIEVAAFAEQGVTVLAHVSLGVEDGYGGLAAEQIAALVARLPQRAMEEAHQVVLSCTGWHTLSLIPALCQQYRRAVLSSNLAIASHARRSLEEQNARAL
ncbi:aspartate racemase/maleate isomerase family protein [Salinactinospora qingdaonensis]